MQEFNYIQKYWFEDYLITQNCGYDENVGEYNGITIYKANKEIKYKEVMHATLSGTKILTKQELEDKIKNYEIVEEKLGENR